jgi:hypothetical protein
LTEPDPLAPLPEFALPKLPGELDVLFGVPPLPTGAWLPPVPIGPPPPTPAAVPPPPPPAAPPAWAKATAALAISVVAVITEMVVRLTAFDMMQSRLLKLVESTFRSLPRSNAVAASHVAGFVMEK